MQGIVTDNGIHVGWFRDPHVVNPAGQDIGFVRGWGLFSYEGALRGYFEDGLFRDRRGVIVARIGKVRDREPVIDWTTPRPKNTCELPLMIEFPAESSADGWKEVFAIAASRPLSLAP